MAIPTLNGQSLEGCKNIAVAKSANIIPLTMPTGDSNDTEVFDLLGVLKTISITGTYSGGTIIDTRGWVADIEALANGNQSTIVFSSDQTGQVQVMIAEVVTDWEVPGFKVDYSIKLIQGQG